MCELVTSEQIQKFFNQVKEKNTMITYEALESKFNQSFKLQLKQVYGKAFLISNMQKHGYKFNKGVFQL